MMCQRSGRLPTGTMGLGRGSVSSRRRGPSPPHSTKTGASKRVFFTDRPPTGYTCVSRPHLRSHRKPRLSITQSRRSSDARDRPMKLLVVILNYRVTDLTIDCLRSLAGRIERVPNAKVAVCENGTGGDAAERLQRAIDENGWAPWADLTVVHPNRGFTGGNNLVIRAAMGSPDPPEYVLLLNADTIVLDGALEALVDVLDHHPRAGIAGSTLVSRDGAVQASPFRFMSLATELDHGLRLGIISKLLSRWTFLPSLPVRASPVEWVSGACMILRCSMLSDIGLLDEVSTRTSTISTFVCARGGRAGRPGS